MNKQIYIREISDCHPTKLQRLSKQLDQKEVLICLGLTSTFPCLLFDVFASSFLNFNLQYYCLLFLGVVELVNQVITPSVTTLLHLFCAPITVLVEKQFMLFALSK